jgi:proline iminopeptidase
VVEAEADPLGVLALDEAAEAGGLGAELGRGAPELADAGGGVLQILDGEVDHHIAVLVAGVDAEPQRRGLHPEVVGGGAVVVELPSEEGGVERAGGAAGGDAELDEGRRAGGEARRVGDLRVGHGDLLLHDALMTTTTTTRIPVTGAELHTRARGRGPACVVLNVQGTAPYERQLPAALDEHMTMVFVDLRGSGQSTGEVADLTFDLLTEDLEAVRAALGVSRVALFGHSILGAVAIECGRRRPESVSHVIAAGAPPSGNMAQIGARAAAYFEEDASDERKQILRDNLARLPPGTPARAAFAQPPMRFSDPRFDDASLYEGAITRPAVLAHVMGTLLAGWTVSASAVPTLLAHGRHDYVVPWILWEPLLPTLPRATLRLFERSGHQPFVEEPDRFTAVVAEWIR